ncbi:MAG: hypothetical protein HFH68_09085 [Lachnospiraceae bacterium]|nr:hypothetical protein [Lachnospiraceae bacterium]
MKVNSTEVTLDEILSDNLYYYYRDGSDAAETFINRCSKESIKEFLHTTFRL